MSVCGQDESTVPRAQASAAVFYQSSQGRELLPPRACIPYALLTHSRGCRLVSGLGAPGRENGIFFHLLHCATGFPLNCTTRLPVTTLFPKGNSTQGPRKHKAQQQRAGMEAVHMREGRWKSKCIKDGL